MNGTMHQIPHLAAAGTSQQLIVNGRPFLMLGGELQNSSLSSSRFMEDVWAKLTAANLNTVLGSVTWEQIEPSEGAFDFADLDQTIDGARRHGLHLVLLWFGSFKNGVSTYTPPWVKTNPQRFPRAQLNAGNGKRKTADVLSIFGSEAQAADAKAFHALMQHLRAVDEHHSTVIMVQVENEVGLLGDSRDRSPLAEDRWKSAVPAELIREVQNGWSKLNQNFRRNLPSLQHVDATASTSWNQLQGDPHLIDELFMAYHYALYVGSVAAAGKQAYPIPLYTNVWQNYSDETRDTNEPSIVAGGDKPGDYPSGGGVTNTLDIWKLFAPSLDLIAPDIYLNDYCESCRAYRHRGQALLIPEQRRDEYGARRIWPAFATYQSIGTAPFGIDTLEPETNPFRRHYALLNSLSHYIFAVQDGRYDSRGFFFDELRPDGSDPSPPLDFTLGAWRLTVERSFVFGKPSAGSGMIIRLSDDRFLLAGWGFQVTFAAADPRATFTGILTFEEKEVMDAEAGELRTLRRLNGDETRGGKFAIMPSEDPDYGGFPICVTIPARTGIAVCQPYALFEGRE